jgi:hypothetical protein
MSTGLWRTGGDEKPDERCNMLTLTDSMATLSEPAPIRAPLLSRRQQQLRVLDLTVELLIARASMGDYWGDGFRDAENLLRFVGFPKAEAQSANHRLQNAVGYCRKQEFGGAAFELRALRGLLHRM